MGWTMSPLVGVAFAVIAVAIRRSVLLFPFRVQMVDDDVCESFEADARESAERYGTLTDVFNLPETARLVIRRREYNVVLAEYQTFENEVVYTIEIRQGKLLHHTGTTMHYTFPRTLSTRTPTCYCCTSTVNNTSLSSPSHLCTQLRARMTLFAIYHMPTTPLFSCCTLMCVVCYCFYSARP